MWKRFGILSVLFFFLLIFFLGAGPLLAACGVDPPVPPGGFAWPLNGEISQGWTLDCPSDRGHRGIDISAGSGLPVWAAAAGTVSFVGYTPAEGGSTTVAIDHEGGLRSTYLHIAGVAVSKGQTVSRGETIGLTDGSPLHFGVKLPGGSRETYFNPTDLLPAPAASAGDPSPEGSQETAPSAEPALTSPGQDAGMPLSQTPQVSEEPVNQAPLVSEMPAAEADEPSGIPLTRGAESSEMPFTETSAPEASPSDLFPSEGFVAKPPATRRWTPLNLASPMVSSPELLSGELHDTSDLAETFLAGPGPVTELGLIWEHGSSPDDVIYPEAALNTPSLQKAGKKERSPLNLRNRSSYMPMTFSILLIIVVAAGLPFFLAKQATTEYLRLAAAGGSALLRGLRF